MANRVPLIINTTANQIQELALGDCLDLTASGIHNAGVITATKFVGDGSLLTNIGGGSAALQDLADDLTPQLGGNLDINGKIINGSGSIVVTGGIQATSFTGDLIGNATTATTSTTATTATTATNAAGLTGNPTIQVTGVVATGHIQADTVSVASTLTYEDVTNIDSIGIVTARTGIKVLSGGIDAIGNITATSFSGAIAASYLTGALPAIDGSALTNLPPAGIGNIVEDTTPQLGGDLDLNGKSILGTTNIQVDAPSGAGVQVTLSNNATAGNGSTPDVSVLGFASSGSLKASIRAAVYGEGWMSFHNNNDTEKLRITAGGQISQGTTVPRERVHFHYDSSDENYLRFTNSTTGTDGADGFNIGLNSAEEALIWNKENTSMLFGTAGTTALTIDTSQNSTFAGSVTSNGITQYLLPTMGNGGQLGYDDATKSLRLYANSSTGSNAKIQFHFNQSGTAAITFNQDSSATFGGSVSDSKGELRKVPLNNQQASANYDLIATDAGKCIHAHATTTEVTVKNSVFAEGDMVTILNGDTTNLNITEDSGFSLRNTGDGTTGNRVLGAFGMATIYFSGPSVGYISGAGLS